jgi:hypothetical protein
VTFPQGILLTVSTVWLLSGLLWQRWRASEDALDALLARLRTVSVFCGVLLTVGFVLLPSVPITAALEDALYAVNVPLLAFSEVYPPLWLLLLAGLLCFVGAFLSRRGDVQGDVRGDVRVLSLTAFLASGVGAAVVWGWWLEPLTFVAVAVRQGAVAWLIGLSVLVIWWLSRRAQQQETVFITWALLVSVWLGLGLTAPGAQEQMPVLSGYYTWLEPVTSQASQASQGMTSKQLAYGGWLLVAVVALPFSVAVAGMTLLEPLTTKTLVGQAKVRQAKVRQAKFPRKHVWLEGMSLALFALLFTLALRYVVTLDAVIGDAARDIPDALGIGQVSEEVRQQALARLQYWRTWLRIVPPYSVQAWLSASLQTGAVVLVVRTLAWALQLLLINARRGLRRVLVQFVKILRMLLAVGLVVALWLEWQPVAVVWLLVLVAVLDTDLQPTVVRSVLFGVLLGQGLGALILGSLQAGSGLGLLAAVVAVWGLQWSGSRLETQLTKHKS